MHQPASPLRALRLMQIGVPMELQQRQLGSMEGGHSVLDWLCTIGGPSFTKGENWYFVTSTIEHHKLLPVIIRQYFLRRGPARFARLGTLIKLLETRNYEEFDAISRQRLLGIGDFFSPAAGPRDRPFTNLQRSRIEEMLLVRKDQRLSTILQIHNPNHLVVNHMPWWTNTAVDRLELKTFRVDNTNPVEKKGLSGPVDTVTVEVPLPYLVPRGDHRC
jgi:hypothetical protein